MQGAGCRVQGSEPEEEEEVPEVRPDLVLGVEGGGSLRGFEVPGSEFRV